MKIGLVGHGKWGKIVARALEKNKNFSLMMVCDKQQQGEFFRKCKEQNVDLVYIATQTKYHFDQTVKCLQYGLDVILEKPATPSFKSAFKLKQLNETYKRKIFINHIYTASTLFQKLQTQGPFDFVSCERLNTEKSNSDISIYKNLMYHDFYIYKILTGKFPTNCRIINVNEIEFDGGRMKCSYSNDKKIRKVIGYKNGIKFVWDETKMSDDTLQNKLNELFDLINRNESDDSLDHSIEILKIMDRFEI